MKMRHDIIVLGHKGMLGWIAEFYFKKVGYNVITTDLRFTIDNLKRWTEFIQSYPNAVILNCIGRIKQKSNDANELLWCNAVIPLQLKNILLINQILINPSTDCVFSGTKPGKKKINDLSDAYDTYGWSKRLGEVALQNVKNALVVRVSIIGPPSETSNQGLLGWFLSQSSNAILNGYSNHYWNGITTLEWCMQVERIINNFEKYIWLDLVQLGTAKVYSKYEILILFNKIFKRNILINEYLDSSTIDRTLEASIISEDIDKQIANLIQLIYD